MGAEKYLRINMFHSFTLFIIYESRQNKEQEKEEIKDADVFGVMVGSLSGGPGGGDGPFRHLLTYYHHTTLYSEDRQTSKNGKTLHSYNIHIFI